VKVRRKLAIQKGGVATNSDMDDSIIDTGTHQALGLITAGFQ